MRIKQLTNEEFNEFTAKCSIKSHYQTPEYGFLMNNQGFDSILLGLERESEIIAATLILKDKSKAYAPRGFLIDYTNYELLKIFTILLKEYMPKIGIKEITISPLVIKNIINTKENTYIESPDYNISMKNLKKLGYIHQGFNNYFEDLKPRYEAILDLDKPYYTLFNNINKEIRTKIRNAENTGITVHRGHIDDLRYLYLHTKNKYPRDLKYFEDCYNYYAKRDNVDFFYTKIDFSENLKFCNTKYIEAESLSEKNNEKLQFIRNEKTLNAKINSDNNLIKAKDHLKKAIEYNKKYTEGVVSASTLIIKNEDEVYMLIDGFDTSFKSFNSKHLLIWKLIEKYSREGYKTFNLGGMTNPNTKSKYDGLNTFKLSFNSNCIEYIGDFKLSVSSKRFGKRRLIKNILKK